EGQTNGEELSARASRPRIDASNDDLRQANGHRLANELIVGKLGSALSAPLPKVLLVDVPAELIRAEKSLRHFSAGLAFGSERIPNCRNSFQILHKDFPLNRSRFALLAVLFGWIHAEDRQFLYQLGSKLIYSVDHGHFFYGSSAWTIATLE